jgi:hypothetical protein
MRKIIGIVIVMLLIGTALTSVGMNTNTINEKEVVITDNDKGCDDCDIRSYGIFNPPVMSTPIEPVSEDLISYETTSIDLPDYFNWRDHEGQDWTTSAKNQNVPRSCFSPWLFAALGALETVINIREGMADLDPDLSEQYVLSCLPLAGSCNGGASSFVYKWIMSNSSNGNNVNGIIPEACFPYEADDTIPCDNKRSDWMDYLIPISEHGGVNIVSKEVVKTTIMDVGPICAYMWANDNFTVWGYTTHGEEDYFPYEYQPDINHAVTIVGWKDDPSIGKGGYWICKNSWGEIFGYDGFFNLEYESLAIERSAGAMVNYNPNEYDWHPVPKTNGPYFGLINEPVSFEGDAEGEDPPFTWLWDFGDGETSDEQNPTHSYSNPGEYTVQLTVTDDNGADFTEKTSVWIQDGNQPPSPPTIEGPTEVAVGERIWYNLSFSDPDGSILYLYVVAFGTESNIWWGPYYTYWQKEFVHWYWEEEGEFIVKAKVKDPYGAESDWTILEVTVPKQKNRDMFNPWFEQLFERIPILKYFLDAENFNE